VGAGTGVVGGIAHVGRPTAVDDAGAVGVADEDPVLPARRVDAVRVCRQRGEEGPVVAVESDPAAPVPAVPPDLVSVLVAVGEVVADRQVLDGDAARLEYLDAVGPDAFLALLRAEGLPPPSPGTCPRSSAPR